MPVLMPYRFASTDAARIHPFPVVYAATTTGLPRRSGFVLFNGCKAGIDINIHSCRRMGSKFLRHTGSIASSVQRSVFVLSDI
jgi:hypothetical protein